MENSDKNVEFLVVDTTAFIENAPLQNFGQHIITCHEVVDEITNKRQLRRLVVLPYDLEIKNVHPENIKVITDFSKKTGDYPSLTATDIKVLALVYQLEKEHVGTEHLRSEPVSQRTVNLLSKEQAAVNADITGFYHPKDKLLRGSSTCDLDGGGDDDHEYNVNQDDILIAVNDDKNSDSEEGEEEYDESDDDSGWITPTNVEKAKSQINSELIEEKSVKVACVTTDFAMQNVLKQINLNVTALDGRIIKQLKTFILRCYTCFGTTSIMTKLFCPKCGNKTLKRVTVSLNEKGEQQIHINPRHPLTTRGKKFSLPRIRGGKHSNNPLLVADQPVPDQRPTRLARTKNNPLDDDYIAGYSPFVMRDITSKSAQLKIRPDSEIKHWMRSNPNESVCRRRRK